MLWIASILTTAAALGILSVGIMLILGQRVLKELTRPGVTIEPGTPEWGNLVLPEVAEMPPEQVRRPVQFRSIDGTRLMGEFWAQDHTAPTIVLCHGYRFPSKHLRSVAALGYSCGANIFSFDFRGHDRSEGHVVTCGNAEVQDLSAAVTIALNQPETADGEIFLLGFSMGAAVAILLPDHPAIKGIIADSPYSRLDDIIRSLVIQTLREETAKWWGLAGMVRLLSPMLARLAIAGGQLLFYLRYRSALVARPDLVIGKREQTTPLVVVHAQGDPFTSHHHARRLVAAARVAGRKVQEYYTPSSTHCGSYGHNPQGYLKLLQEFVSI